MPEESSMVKAKKDSLMQLILWVSEQHGLPSALEVAKEINEAGDESALLRAHEKITQI